MKSRLTTKPATSTAPAATRPEERARVHTRYMLRRDLTEAVEIERAGAHEPWCDAEFCSRLKAPHCIGIVAEHGGRVVGFMVYEVERTHYRLLKLAVAPDFRRRGAGRQLVARLVGRLGGRRNRIVADVRETNLGGQLVLKALGLRAEAVIRGFYGDGRDAFRFEYDAREDAFRTA
jgi:ribosomal-protein-alanine N-acetyltransferase